MNQLLQYGIALLPILITAITVVVVMLGIAWRRSHTQTFLLTVVGLNAALVSVLATLPGPALDVTPLLRIDHFAAFFMALVLIAALACATLAHAYLEGGENRGYPGNREEFYLLLLLATTGGLVMAGANHFAGLFIGLELLSVPLYGLIGYAFFNRHSLEASMKYLVLSGAGSAFLLFGMALWYAEVGDLGFPALAEAGFQGPLSQLGLAMLLVGFGFKISLVPFHVWTPDVYQGAPAPASALLASASKVAIFAVLLRLFEALPINDADWVRGLLVVLGIASMLAGNLLALMQSNLKRLLGYSSVAHFGYLLMVLAAGAGARTETTAVYLATYLLTTLGAFGVITLMSSPYQDRDCDELYEYRGLFWRRPYLTAVLTVMMLSLAGIPMTAGFIGKFYLIFLGVDNNLWWMLGALILGSAIGLFYYLRVMVTMYLVEPSMRRRDAPENWGQQAGGVMLLLVAALVIVLGVYPQPLLELSRLVALGG